MAKGKYILFLASHFWMDGVLTGGELGIVEIVIPLFLPVAECWVPDIPWWNPGWPGDLVLEPLGGFLSSEESKFVVENVLGSSTTVFPRFRMSFAQSSLLRVAVMVRTKRHWLQNVVLRVSSLLNASIPCLSGPTLTSTIPEHSQV